METHANGAFRFGRFELDLRTRELRKDGIRVRLQGQPFEVLAMLLERPGDVVTREQIRQRLWPEGTFVDFEHGLNAAVKRLRAALGDNAERPRFVDTLPRHGYRFIGPVERPDVDDRDDREAAGGMAPAHKRRLAVLPFPSREPGGEVASPDYFSDGLREEMITRLGRLCAGRLGVIARTSSTLIQRTATRVRDIGQALRVDYVVEGNVRREGDRARITVQLVETRGETQLWAESYERQLADCFQVQSEVATEIAHSLAVELLPVNGEAAVQAGTRHVDAHQAYLKGRYHWNKPANTGVIEAIGYLQQAVALDPRFACAHAALGRAQVGAVNYSLVEPRAALESARQEAQRALELDPTDSEAHLVLAEVDRILKWDWAGAEKGYRRALAFNPSNVAVNRHYGLYLAARRRTMEAQVATDRAYDLDPLCLDVNTSAAWVRFVARDYAAAIERCRHTLDMDNGFVSARRLLAAALLQGGRADEAAAELDVLANGRLDPVTMAWVAHGFASQGDKARAGAMLDQLEQLSRDCYVPAYYRALVHTALGDRDGALALLVRGAEQREPAIVNLAVDPRLDPLGADPRFTALVDKLGLPD